MEIIDGDRIEENEMHPAQIQMVKAIKAWNALCEQGLLDDIGGFGAEFWFSMMIPVGDNV